MSCKYATWFLKQAHQTVGYDRYNLGNIRSKQYRLPDSKVHGAYMGLIWGRQGPGEPHVGPVNFALWAALNMLIPGPPLTNMV